MDIAYGVLIWMCSFCGLCALLYLCTVRAYLKGWKGRFGQALTSKPHPAGNLPISVYVIAPDKKIGIGLGHLNYDDVLEKEKRRKKRLETTATFLYGSSNQLVREEVI